MLVRLIVILFVIHCPLAFASDIFVVTESYTGATVIGREPFTLSVGEVVTVAGISDESSLVKSEQRSCCTQGGIWVPTTILVNKRSFRPVSQWRGQQHIEVGGGDYHARYDFNRDGRVKYHIDEVPSDGDKKNPVLRGQLYRFKNLLWAKLDNAKEIMQGDVFLIDSNGHTVIPIY
jgi:hypothetical protein